MVSCPQLCKCPSSAERCWQLTLAVLSVLLSVVDALLVAMELLSTRVGRLKFNKRVFLITDAACPISWAEDEDGLSSIVAGIAAGQYRVNVIGINFSEVEEADEDDGIPLVRHGSAVERRTMQQQRNERVLRDLCDKAEGVVFNVDSALSLMRTFRRQINQVTKFRGPLQIGSVNIEVFTYTQTQAQSLPTMKKQVTEAERVGGGTAGQSGKWGGDWGGEGEGEGGEVEFGSRRRGRRRRRRGR